MSTAQFFMKTLVACMVSLVLLGCTDNQAEKDEAEFRKSLIEKALNDETRKEGDAFLKENLKLPSIQSTSTGLQYEVINEAKDAGASPRLGDQVDVLYKGSTINGHIFADSLSEKDEQNKISTFPLNKVIKGWREALMMMRPGDHWILYLPPELAYGATSPSEDIPANSTLIYEIKLVDFTSLEDSTQSGSQHE